MCVCLCVARGGGGRRTEAPRGPEEELDAEIDIESTIIMIIQAK